MIIAVTARSQATRFESNFSADREPRTPAESTLPNRATRKIRRARNARKKRKNGTSRKITCHQFLRQKLPWNRATYARKKNSATNTLQKTQPTTEGTTWPVESVTRSCAGAARR